jgi:hypothetical protein
MGRLPGTPGNSPSGVAVTAGGHWAFASLGTAVAVLRLSAGGPADLVHSIELPISTAGMALTPDGRYLLPAGGAGAVVVSVSAAEQGSSQTVLGELSVPDAGGYDVASASGVATSADGRYAFVSLEYADQVAVFDLAIPTQAYPVGLALSPDGHRHRKSASLAIVDVRDALAGRPAQLGYLPAGQFPRDMRP